MKRAIVYVIVALLGVAPGFFMVLNALFSDSNGWQDDLIALVVTGAAYIVLGVVAGLLVRGAPRSAAATLAAAGVAVAVLYTLSEPSVWPLAVLQALAAVAAAWVGAEAGTRAGATWRAARAR